MRRLTALTVLTALTISTAWADPGHAHGDEATPAPAVASAPRLESVGSTMELVATSEGLRLVIYLDKADTNEPIDQLRSRFRAKVSRLRPAQRIAPGTYELEADWVDRPARRRSFSRGDNARRCRPLEWTMDGRGHRKSRIRERSRLLEILARPEVLGLLGGALALGFVLALALRPRSRDASAVEEHAGAPTGDDPRNSNLGEAPPRPC